MKKYRVTIIETLKRNIIVEADDGDEAIDKVDDMVRNSDIVLDADDYFDSDYAIEIELENTRKVNCLQCGRQIIVSDDDISTDELGSHTVCPYCRGSFDV